MLRDIRRILGPRNTLLARVIILLLYFEKRFSFKLPFKIIRKLFVQIGLNCVLHPDSFISPFALATLRLPHPFLIIIQRKVKIGANCTIFHGVTIGVVEGKGKSQSALALGDNVYIGCLSTLLGDIRVGDNVKLGANTIVTKSVPEGLTVIGSYNR